MLDLNLLRTFVFVAENRKLIRAADALNMPTSTVSRHLAKLEERTGSVLLKRGKDGFTLTPSGERLYSRTKQSIHDLTLDDADAAIPKQRGTVRLQTPAIYGQGVLIPILVDYLAERPECDVDVIFADRFSAPDLEEIDIGVFVGLPPGNGVDLWPIGFVEARLYASPALFGDSEPPVEPKDLKKWPALTNDCSPGKAGSIRISKTSYKLGPVRLTSADPTLLLKSALAGVGIARLPKFFADPYVETGDLLPVLPGVAIERHSITMARSRRNKNPTSTDLVEYIKSALGDRR